MADSPGFRQSERGRDETPGDQCATILLFEKEQAIVSKLRNAIIARNQPAGALKRVTEPPAWNQPHQPTEAA